MLSPRIRGLRSPMPGYTPKLGIIGPNGNVQTNDTSLAPAAELGGRPVGMVASMTALIGRQSVQRQTS